MQRLLFTGWALKLVMNVYLYLQYESVDIRPNPVITGAKCIFASALASFAVATEQNMAAGGGRQAANHVYETARPDGLLRFPEWLEKGLADVHASIEIPKSRRHPRFAQLPELEAFSGTAREKRLLEMFRSFRLSGHSFCRPRRDAKEPVQILRAAMRKTLADPEFPKEFNKLTGDDATPLMPEALENAVWEMPRDADDIALFNKRADPSPLPLR